MKGPTPEESEEVLAFEESAAKTEVGEIASKAAPEESAASDSRL